MVEQWLFSEMHVPLNPVVSGRFSFESSSSISIKSLDAPLELLAGVSLEEFGAGVSLEEFGTGFSLEEFGTGVSLEEFGTGFSLEEFGAGVSLDEVGAGVSLEEFGAGVSLDEVGAEVSLDEGAGLLDELGTGSLDGLETDSLSQLIQQRAAPERSSFPKSLWMRLFIVFSFRNVLFKRIASGNFVIDFLKCVLEIQAMVLVFFQEVVDVTVVDCYFARIIFSNLFFNFY